MIILGLDPSQKTGWAFYDDKADFAAMRCGVLKIDAEAGEFEKNASQAALALVQLLQKTRDKDTGKVLLPDFAVVERAPRQPYGSHKPKLVKFMGTEVAAQGDEGGGNGLQSTLSTNQMAAALCAVLGAYRIPFESLTDSDWRKKAYGFGKQKGWTRADYKKHARTLCAQNKIAVTNDDMAEACWIAFAGASCQTFRAMQARAAA